MAWVAISVLLMFGAGLLVLMTALISLLVPAIYQLVLAIRRSLVAGLVPSTFELPEIHIPPRLLGGAPRLVVGRSTGVHVRGSGSKDDASPPRRPIPPQPR